MNASHRKTPVASDDRQRYFRRRRKGVSVERSGFRFSRRAHGHRRRKACRCAEFQKATPTKISWIDHWRLHFVQHVPFDREFLRYQRPATLRRSRAAACEMIPESISSRDFQTQSSKFETPLSPPPTPFSNEIVSRPGATATDLGYCRSRDTSAGSNSGGSGDVGPDERRAKRHPCGVLTIRSS